MNKVMLFLGIVLLALTSWLSAQSKLGFYDEFVWNSFATILAYFVVRAVLTLEH